MDSLGVLGQEVEEFEAGLDEATPLVLYGNEQSERLDEVRSEAEEAGPLVERFLDEAELAEFEIAEAAVDEAGGVGCRTKRQIGRIDEPDADVVEDEFARGGGTVDSAAEDDYRFVGHFCSKNAWPQYACGGQFEQYDAVSGQRLRDTT